MFTEEQQHLQAYSKTIGDLQAIRDQLERKLQEDASGYEQQMSELIKSHQAELAELRRDLMTQQQQNTVLKGRLRELQIQFQEGSSSASAPNVVDEVKKVMNVLYHMLQPHFVPQVSYDGLKIRRTVMSNIRDVTVKYIEVNSSRSQHANDAVNGIHAPVVTTGSAVTSEVGRRAAQASVHEPVAPMVEGGGSAKKPGAQEDSDCLSKSLQNSGLEAAVSDSSEPMRTAAAQEKNQLEEEEEEGEEEEGSHVGSVVDRQTDLDPPVQVDNAGEPTRHIRLVPVTEMDDFTDQMEESKEKDGRLRESSLERSWRPQPPPPPLFDDDDEEEDDDWLS
ncbi:uncharacterized protein LOC111873650 [Cryptotermes secundus]|uniref:uncharacterized protein LOC111873650 n=1 Tax=Cryptotermes secundus TaxID=105785 RepID=UPI000CD7AE72|nr:uncharacterized protein LOC111873650 [Cryptotermes secundus]